LRASAGVPAVYQVSILGGIHGDTNEVPLSAYHGRFFPLTITRKSRYENRFGRELYYLPHVERPLLTPKLRQIVLEPATGNGSAVSNLIARGVAVHPKHVDHADRELWLSAAYSEQYPSSPSSQEVDALMKDICANGGRLAPHHEKRVAQLKSSVRTALNGLSINRVKYTTFSRHYTTAPVLQAIAKRIQSLLKPGDTYVDFACGQNSFGAMLTDPITKLPLPTVAFDILSPAEKTADFTRRPWHSVDAHSLPPGELVIGLNPPFGHNGREAQQFVEHALCARPRMLVLIMPATNYTPPGYDLAIYDDQLCRGFAFYAPGTNVSNNINAHHMSPNFLVYVRKGDASTVRDGRCCHVRSQLTQMMQFRTRHAKALASEKRKAYLLEESLCGMCE